MADKLLPAERKIVALALFTAGRRGGPKIFDSIGHIIEKLGLEKEFIEISENWQETEKDLDSLNKN